jgi:hypothetical protein
MFRAVLRGGGVVDGEAGGGGGGAPGDGGAAGEGVDGGGDAKDAPLPKSSEDADAGVDDNGSAAPTNDVRSIATLTPEQLMPLYVTMSDFLEAMPHVQPSSKREGFATVPDVSWSDIGALSSIREELTLSVLEPISHPERFEALGLPLPAGVLLYRPPGCGKVCYSRANGIIVSLVRYLLCTQRPPIKRRARPR